MISQVTVLMSRSPDLFLEAIDYGLQWLRERGFKAEVALAQQNGLNHITISLSGDGRAGIFHDEDLDYIFKYHLAENLAEIIIEQWEADLIRREVHRRYRKSPPEEQDKLLKKARDFMQKSSESEIKLLLRMGRRNRITDRIFEYLYIWGNKLINLDGFINFYLGDYIKEIRMALELASEELRNEKEYQEFVHLLKCFVDAEPPKKLEVHVKVAADGIFQIWDQEGKNIDADFVEYYWDDLIAEEMTLDDLLISILISIAPRRLVIHASQEKMAAQESLALLCQVFAERIFFCPGCERCSKFLVTHK